MVLERWWGVNFNIVFCTSFSYESPFFGAKILYESALHSFVIFDAKILYTKDARKTLMKLTTVLLLQLISALDRATLKQKKTRIYILPPTRRKVAFLFINVEPRLKSTKFDQLNYLNFNYLIMITWISFYWNWLTSPREIKVLKRVNKLFFDRKLKKVGKWSLFCLLF